MSYIIDQIASEFGLSLDTVDKIIKSSPFRYKVFNIPKKQGGERTIAQPAKEVKILQYWVLNNILMKYAIHPCSYAYYKGANIKDNAESHKDQQFLLKVDFKNFFTSILDYDFRYYLYKYDNFDEQDINTLINLLFWSPRSLSEQYCLSIGAPTSPYVSNILMFDFDHMLNDICQNYGIVYTRYADDLTFSTNIKNTLPDFYKKLKQFVTSTTSPNLEINYDKTLFSSKKHRRRVTGIILTNSNELSLGREKKRMLRSKINHFKNNNLSDNECLELKGLLSFAWNIEPGFIHKMKQKYGNDVIYNIFKYNNNASYK